LSKGTKLLLQIIIAIINQRWVVHHLMTSKVPLDHIIIWILSDDGTVEMPALKGTVQRKHRTKKRTNHTIHKKERMTEWKTRSIPCLSALGIVVRTLVDCCDWKLLVVKGAVHSQEVNSVANLPGWTSVLEAMIKSRQADLAFRTAKQDE